MPIVRGKEPLCKTESPSQFFKSKQGIEGQDIFSRYPAIENVINKNIDVQFQHYLAQPVVERDDIYWFSSPFTEKPERLSDLNGSERDKYEKINADTVAHFRKKILELNTSGKTNEAEILDSALKFVNPEFVYCYDGKTVLGVWGMQLRDKVQQPYGVAIKDIYNFRKKQEEPKTEPTIEPAPIIEPEPIHIQQTPTPAPPQPLFNIRFNAGDKGTIQGTPSFQRYGGEYILFNDIPNVQPNSGYQFAGWDIDPNHFKVNGDIVFNAKYRDITPAAVVTPVLPWYVRFWNWLRNFFFGKGCLRWLLWLLIILLLLILFWWLFRNCERTSHILPTDPIHNAPIHGDHPGGGDGHNGGIYDPVNPYTPVPTPPEYGDVLPPNQGVLPPVDTSNLIRKPDRPVIVGNRLNILMENEDKSIMDLAKAFKEKYPDDKYKVVYYDDVVKRMQIEFPEEEREKLKADIPAQFSPEYELFVFDESLFEASYTPSDPAFNSEHAWYLKAINAPNAWDITKGDSKVTVAIVDNGFNLDHPEFNGKVIKPYNVWTHSDQIFAHSVDHGTHVAGTALAIIDNGKGLCGIAPNCTFMPIQVANRDQVMTTTSILDGVLYALYQGATAINVSLGPLFATRLPEPVQRDIQDNHFKEEERLWNEIMRIADKRKAIIVIAAGNDNMLAGLNPMNRPKNFIVVSAVDKKMSQIEKAEFSNYGEYSTISAPGVAIYSSVGHNGFTTMDGTSMATPIVTGSIALMKSLNPNLNAEQIICVLQGSGKRTSNNIGPLIQIDDALLKVKSGNIDDCSSRPDTPSTGDVQILLKWSNYNDLDLGCTDPQGNTVSYRNKRVPSGGRLEIDMNVKPNDSKTPIENIFWPTGGAPNGTYHVYLNYYQKHENPEETPYHILVKYGEKKEEFNGTVKNKYDQLHICSFVLGGSSSAQPPSDPVQSRTREELLEERERKKRELEEIERKLNGLDQPN